MLAEKQCHTSYVHRETRVPSTFRPPPKLLRCLPPQSKTLTAMARPWYPKQAGSPNGTGVAPAPKPVLASPPALGTSPELRPVAAIYSIDDACPSCSPNTLFSPLTTPVRTVSHLFTEEATRDRVYPLEMFLSVRKDAGHTPYGVLRWCVRQYVEVPTLRVPRHLTLSMNVVVNSEDGIARGAVGCGLKHTTRSKPVRQVHHKVMSVLSRITPQKYNELLEELLQFPLRQTDDAELQEVAKVFFSKAVQEPEYGSLYARLAKELCTMKDNERELEAELRDRLLCNRMRRHLIMSCEEEFCRPIELTPDEKVDRTTGKPLEEEAIDMKRTRMKNRLVGNVKFVGELFKMGLVTEHVIEDIFHLLIDNYDPNHPTVKEEYVFEVFATLIKSVAPVFKTQRPNVLAHLLGVAKLVEQSHPRPRIHFLMLDVADLNQKEGWISAERVYRDAAAAENRQASAPFNKTDDHISPFSAIVPRALDANVLCEGTQRALPVSTEAMPPARDIQMREPASNNVSSVGTSRVNVPHKMSIRPSEAAQKLGNIMASSDACHTPLLPKRQSASLFSPHTSEQTRTPLMSDGPGTQFLQAAHPPAGGESVNMGEVAKRLMLTFKEPEEVSSVMRCIDEMSLRNKVLCLTWWLRQVSTNTALFEDRERVVRLFSCILASCPSFRPADLLSAVLEWVQFDIEKATYINCPRMFDNVAHIILHCYSREASQLQHIEAVRHILHGGVFNVMLRRLATSGGACHMVTLLKSVLPISSTLLASIQDKEEDGGIFRSAVEHRFRLLPYFFAVSTCVEGDEWDMARGGRLGDSSTCLSRYDPLVQCMDFSCISDDPEFVVLRMASLPNGSTSEAWRMEALKLALTSAGSGSLTTQVLQVMKVVGSLLACSRVCVRGTNLVSFSDVEWITREVVMRRSGALFEAAVAMELIMHFTLALGDSHELPPASGRMKLLRRTFNGWCEKGILHRSVVMDMLKCLDDPSLGPQVYPTYHNSIAEECTPWNVLLSELA